jgi:alginate O-acetyltransferase complex protein AlgJ
MRSSRTIGAVLALSIGAGAFGALRFADFKGDLAAKVEEANKANASVVSGQDGWLFFAPELRHLSVGAFWGDAAKSVSKATSPTKADPLPAILDFNDQLKKAGIDLLVVPVPAKAAIYPEMIVPGATNSESARLDASDAEFIGVLKGSGVNVLDLVPAFLQYRKDHPDRPLYSKEDTHWSGYGLGVAADLVSEQVKKEPWYAGVAQTKFGGAPTVSKVTGDLVQYMTGAKPGPEDLVLFGIKDDKGGPVKFSRQSPLVLLGDSHNLVYSIGGDMLATSSGFPENVAAMVGFVPDVVGVMGSGATPARINLARRADNMAGKKMVIWCFSVREFTEGTGWSKVPVIKAAQ